LKLIRLLDHSVCVCVCLCIVSNHKPDTHTHTQPHNNNKHSLSSWQKWKYKFKLCVALLNIFAKQIHTYVHSHLHISNHCLFTFLLLIWLTFFSSSFSLFVIYRLVEALTSWYEGAGEHFGWNCKCHCIWYCHRQFGLIDRQKNRKSLKKISLKKVILKLKFKASCNSLNL